MCDGHVFICFLNCVIVWGPEKEDEIRQAEETEPLPTPEKETEKGPEKEDENRQAEPTEPLPTPAKKVDEIRQEEPYPTPEKNDETNPEPQPAPAPSIHLDI